ncbi:MAG: S26 family signal peptidase [Pseudomonadota bacterium]
MTDGSNGKVGKPKISRARRALGYGTIFFGVGCIVVFDQFDIIMNASQSLDEPAFVLFEHPVFLRRGAVVAAAMPDVLHEQFGDYLFVKRIGGLPGDEITLDTDGSPCVNGQCYPLWLKDDEPVAARIEPGIIPDGHYAVFGNSPDSLDSRYSVVGLIAEDQLVGRGWPLPLMPDWREAGL